jgi:hypothetical protein
MSVLGIPVDHRLRDIIRGLMKLNEAPSSPSDSSNHSGRLRQLAQSMRHRGWLISESEVDFACYLAEPAVQGGIVVALTQPPQYQDYSIPTDEIVEGCNTLLALRQLADFFNLPFDCLSIFDAYPFITEKELDQKDIDHFESHTTFHQMILDKRPRAILSGWTSPSFAGLPTKSLKKRAIGAIFPSPTIRYDELTISMVNMPHPSYYMNYYPTESCFRQLQVLEFAQACGRLWGTWQEMSWMADLRGKCRVRAKFLYDSKFDSSSMFICVNRGDWCDSSNAVFVTERLTQTLTRLEPLLSGMRYGFSSKAQIGDDLAKNNILELCSDASLILRHVDAMFSDAEGTEWAQASMTFTCSWYNCRWPALSSSSVPTSAGLPGLYAHDGFDRIPVLDLPPLARQIELSLVEFAKKMNLTWTPYGDGTFEPDFDAQASAFFDLAKGIEDAMDEIPDNIRVQHIATSKDVATETLMKRLAELGI